MTIAALITVTVLLLFCGGVLASSLRSKNARGSAADHHQSELAADAGIAHAIVNLANGDDSNIGGPLAPLEFGGGTYWATLSDNGDDSYTVTSYAQVAGQATAVVAVLTPAGGDIYSNAVFAGNSSGESDYVLEFGGEGVQADDIGGDIYSGNDVSIEGDSTIGGTIRAGGTITGGPGEEGVTRAAPDLAAMNYATTADFDVAALFASGASYKYDNAGGNAWQLPESSPAHIFRKNPSDRTANTSLTSKDDYFLEDPYEPVKADYAQDGSDPYTFTLSGTGSEPGPDSNGKVFFIDGNLWIHNKRTYSLGLKHNESSGVQVTFVVKGNIYMADNLFYDDEDADGMAFIAMKDPTEPDSGNIYFGDPVFGTLQQMQSFMFAENNFYDNNLDASGSETVALYGNMTAGNQVVIERDYGGQHTKLTVNFDDRITTGKLEMPGLPGSGSAGSAAYAVTYWQRVAHP